MPDRRQHRGAHPEDGRLFAPAAWPRLRAAVTDLSYLLGREYNDRSALKIVGDRYALTERQRAGVMRCACSDSSLRRRRERQAAPADLRGRTVLLDGFNVLLTVEVALSGGVVLCARDGCYRDLASVHGSYRKVEETLPALRVLGAVLADLGAGRCRVYLDSPVGNSGRLRALIETTAAAAGWPWTVELVPSPDSVLVEAADIVATADSVILDRCARWVALAREAVARCVPAAYVVDLSGT